MSEPHRIRLGTQGWNYAGWVGPFYPSGTRPRDFLKLYSRGLDTVEVDSTFYAIPAASTVRGWVERTPEGFTFSLKVPRDITHEQRLVGTDALFDEFTDRARELGPKLGPILIQLGPDFAPSERSALQRFLARLPPDLRFAVEFRQRGWINEETHSLLTDHQVALALTEGKWIPREWALSLLRRPTADFHYLRWMGEHDEIVDFSQVQVDRSAELREWADAMAELPSLGFTVYGYVNNHFSGHSPATVRALLRLLGEKPVAPEELGDQISLF
jgi:uncharacterized protein YecE (DUF72 family)